MPRYLYSRWFRVVCFGVSAMGISQASHGHVEGAGGLAREYDKEPANVDGFEEHLDLGRSSPGDADELRSVMADEGETPPASGKNDRLGMKLVGNFIKQEAWSLGESPSARSNSPTSEIGDHRRLSTSSTDTALCQNDHEKGRACYSCLQWSCEQGFYAKSEPNCFIDTLNLDDGALVEESGESVRRCSDATCCEPEQTDVWNCRGYPSCPFGYEGLFVPCTLHSGSNLPRCDDRHCCGAPAPPTSSPTPSPSIVVTSSPTVAFVLTLTPTAQRTAPPISTSAPTVGTTVAPSIAKLPATAEPVEATPAPSDTEAPTPAPSFHLVPTEALILTLAPTPSITTLPTASPTWTPTGAPVAAPTSSLAPTPTPAEMVAPAHLSLSPTTSPTGAPVNSPAPAFTATQSPTINADSSGVDKAEAIGTYAAGVMSSLVVAAGVLLVVSSLAGEASDAPASRIRSPAATLGVVTISQVQSLSVLSLVGSIGSGDSSLTDFTDSLRWVNLWPSDSFAGGFLTTSNSGARRLDDGDSTSYCVFSESDDDDIGMLVFIGNLVLVVSVLLGIFFIHVALVSAIEAYWLAKKRAKVEIAEAQRRGIPLCDILVPERDGKQQPQETADLSVGRTPPGSKRKSDSLALTSSRLGRQELGEGKERDLDDDKDGEQPTAPRNSQDQILECRNQSDSAWLHFPNIELVFLFFSFEGAVAAPIGALREGGCSVVSTIAVIALLVYPIFMLAVVCRTVLVRVQPDALIVFKPDDDEEDGPGDKPSFFSRVKTGVTEENSMFAWADKGSWETVKTAHEEDRQHGDSFRIGFEPVFVDFTKTGAWFAVFALVEAAAEACIGVLIDDSATQLFSLCGLYTVAFVTLIWVKPFANAAVNAIAAGLELVNVITTAMLGVIALGWEGTAAADRVDTAVMIIEIVALCALTIPVYIDTGLSLVGAIRGKVQRAILREAEDGVLHAKKKEERTYIRGYVRRAWARNWWTMFSTNISVFARETSEGIREPHVSTSTPLESSPHLTNGVNTSK